MRRLLYIAAILCLSATITTGCRTNESNYRRAYERAIEGRENAVDFDSTVYGAVRRQMKSRSYTLADGTSVPVNGQHVRITEGGGGSPENLHRYNVVVGRFKQLFNARSLRNRLVDGGLAPGAFVVETGEPYYYIVASSHRTLAEAAEALARLPEGIPGMSDPLPFILDATARLN